MSTVDEIQMMRDWLSTWAAERKLIFEDKSEVGFGRPCVGITDGHAYIDLGPSTTYEPPMGGDGIEFPESLPEAQAPEGVNAYHKSDCLAVLCPDENYDNGIEQLFRWVQKIDEAGLVIKREPRQHRNVIEAIIHGHTRTFLDRPEGDS